MTEILTPEKLTLTHPAVREATEGLLGRALKPDAVKNFINQLAAPAAAPAIGAQTWIALAIGGTIITQPSDMRTYPWEYRHVIWGGPVCVATAVGLMYTAYDNWDAFFQNVTSCHAHGVTGGGGLMQVNWFRADATPVGQFNGVSAGIGAFEAGGAGKWAHPS